MNFLVVFVQNYCTCEKPITLQNIANCFLGAFEYYYVLCALLWYFHLTLNAN